VGGVEGPPSAGVSATTVAHDLCFYDNDMDGWGNDNGDTVFSADACYNNHQESYNSLDCNDFDANTYPRAPDPLGDGVDTDCDGVDG